MCNFNDLPTLPTLARGARSLRSFALRSGGPLAPRQVELNALEGSRLRQSGQPKTQEPREGLPAPDMPPSSPSTG
eukprot:g23935.t1